MAHGESCAPFLYKKQVFVGEQKTIRFIHFDMHSLIFFTSFSFFYKKVWNVQEKNLSLSPTLTIITESKIFNAYEKT